MAKRKRAKRPHRYNQPKVSISQSMDEAGWISTPIAHLNVLAADHQIDRRSVTIPYFDSIRSALKGTEGFHDLTCRRRARGVLTYGELTFVV